MAENFKDRLYIATVCGQHREIIDKYWIGVELDQFCTAENMDGGKFEAADAEVRELLEAADSRSIIHAPFNELCPAAIDPLAKELAYKRFDQAAELAIRYGADKMVVHTGYIPLVYFKEWHVERSVEFWDRFMEGKPDGFKIVIENVMEDEPYMILKMMEQLKNPNIRLCLDTGHAACISKVPVLEWLDVMAPYLGHIHLHNNNGEYDYHSPIMEGVIPMDEFMESFTAKCGDDVTMTLETLDGLSSMEWLKARGYI